jgi:hypothetical protein
MWSLCQIAGDGAPLVDAALALGRTGVPDAGCIAGP